MADAQQFAINVDEVTYEEESACRRVCRVTRSCMRVSPWVPLIAAIMTAVGLPFWIIYMGRALNYTTEFAEALTGQQIWIVEELRNQWYWVSTIGLAVSCSIIGLALLVSFIRTYQKSAQLPSTRCSAPGKCSYGSYMALITVINLLVWVLTLVVVATLCATFAWQYSALLLRSTLDKGVQHPSAAPQVSAQEQLAQAKTFINSLAGVSNPDAATEAFVAAAREVTVVLCPATCLNIGSFAAVLKVDSSCYCNTQAFPHLMDTSQDVWVSLTYAEGGLVLLGIACLWLLMNLSANFAHARRDIRELPGYGADAAAEDACMDAPAVAYASRIKRESEARKRQDVHRSSDTDMQSGASSARDAAPAPGAARLPEAVINPAAADAALPYTAAYPPPKEAGSEAATSTPTKPTQDPSPRATETQPLSGDSPSSAQLGRAYSNTAQRYAAYRLRTNSAKGTPGATDSRKWVR